MRLICWIGVHKTRGTRRWYEDGMFVCTRCRRCKCIITIAVLGIEG